MFKKFFNANGNSSKTCFFKVEYRTLIEIRELHGNGSINSAIESLGFSSNHVHIVLPFDSDKISVLGFKTLSKDLVLVMTKNSETKITYSDVQKVIDQIDWDFEYSSLRIEDILNEGIDLENFDLKFLMSVVDLKEEGDNMYKSERLGLYFQFDNGILKAITSTTWENSATKWLYNLNPNMVNKMKEEAQQYHINDIDSIEEVNKQVETILRIPNAINNEFIHLHRKKNGNVSFYNLLITHYKSECSITEFLFMNKGRFRKINENTIEVGNFIYSFNIHGQLESVVNK